jgi:hypothetical protein
LRGFCVGSKEGVWRKELDALAVMVAVAVAVNVPVAVAVNDYEHELLRPVRERFPDRWTRL